MNIPKFSVKNRLLVNLLSGFVLLAGVFTLMNMKIEAFPSFSFDIVSISTSYPGATPEEVEKLITRPIEEELRSVGDIDEMTSVSAEGFSNIVLKIDPDAKNKPRIVMDIQQAVDRVDDFPSDLERLPSFREIRTQDSPVIEVTVSGDLPRFDVQAYARKLEVELEEIKGVSDVARNGWQDEEIWVELDATKMELLRVSMTEVVRAIRSRHVNVPGGLIDDGAHEFLVRTNAEFSQPEEIDEVVVRANETGRVIRVKDLGKARWSFQEGSLLGRLNGFDGVSLVVVKKEAADTLELVAEVENVVERFKHRAPKELHLDYVNDISFFVKRRLGILTNNGIVGLIMVLSSLFIFLSFPVAFWTVVGLPVAAGIGIWAMTLFGISINLISMFGMIMVIGMLVDDAIIVAENVYRKIELGMSPKAAAVEGATEVIKPVTTAIMTSVIVFLPLAFMSGIMGKFIWTIPIVVIIMLASSWIESIVVLPSHLTEFEHKRKEGEKKKVGTILFDWMGRHYIAVLEKILRRRKVVTPVLLALVFGGIALGVMNIPMRMFPGKGIEIFFIRAEAELGTSLDQTAESFRGVEKLVAELPEEELKNYMTIVGRVQQDPHDPFTTRGSHVGQVVVYLHPEGDRGRKAYEIMDYLRPKLKDIKGFERVWIDEVKPGPPVGKPVSVRVRGDQFEILEEIAERIKRELETTEGVIEVRDDFEPGKSEYLVEIDDVETARAGLVPADIARAVRNAFAGEIAAIIREGDEDVDVVVRLQESQRRSPKILERLFVQNPRGFLVPLSKVAKIKEGVGPSVVKHLDSKRVINVSASLEGEKATSVQVNKKIERWYEKVSKDYLGYTLDFGGEAKDTKESMESLMRAFLLASFLVFIILASAFNSLVQPLLIMIAIPFGLFSALLALKLHGEPLSFMAILGMVGLSGVAVNDSIVLVDFINRRRKEHASVLEAVVSAGRTRLRPVVLTSVTTVVGLAPVAYGIGGADPFLKPMALVMAWGLALATILTLILVPTLYLVLDDIRRATRRRFFSKELPNGEADGS